MTKLATDLRAQVMALLRASTAIVPPITTVRPLEHLHSQLRAAGQKLPDKLQPIPLEILDQALVANFHDLKHGP